MKQINNSSSPSLSTGRTAMLNEPALALWFIRPPGTTTRVFSRLACRTADRSLVLGSPGKLVRELDEQEIERSRAIAQSYVTRGGRYKTALKRIG